MIPETSVYRAGRNRPCSKCKSVIAKGEMLLIVTNYVGGRGGSSYKRSVSYCRLCAVKIIESEVREHLHEIEEALNLIGDGA